MRKTILVAVLLLPSLALASGYSLPNTNPRDLSLSASAVAAQQDSAAASALPAALSRLDGPSGSISAGGVMIFQTWKDPTGASPNVDMKRQIAPIGSLSVAYGGKIEALGGRGWGVGLGIQPYGGAVVQWPDDWAGRYRITKVERRVFSGVLTAGVEVIPQVRLGGGLVYYYTTEKLSQHAFMAPFAGTSITDVGNPATWNPALPDAVGTIDASGGALSFDVSGEFALLKDLTLAVDYKHKATQSLDGNAKWSNLTPLASALGDAGAAPFKDMGANHQLTIPNRLEVGAAYRVVAPLLVTAAWTWDRWSVYDADVFVGDNGATIRVPRDYANGYTFRGGAEYDVAKTFQVRVGLQRDVSGLNKRYYSPTLPDASSWAGSLGATYKFGRGISADAAVFYAIMDQVKAEDPNTATPGTGLEPTFDPANGVFIPQPEGTFRGTYDISALVFAVSVSWTPGAK